MSYKSLNDPKWPEYLQLRKHNQPEQLRNRNKHLMRTYEKNTFCDDSAIIYNDLPESIRNAATFSTFCSQIKNYLLDKALARVI